MFAGCRRENNEYNSSICRTFIVSPSCCYTGYCSCRCCLLMFLALFLSVFTGDDVLRIDGLLFSDSFLRGRSRRRSLANVRSLERLGRRGCKKKIDNI